VAAPISDVRTYGDFAGLEALKKSAHGDDPAAIREVARQFESLFARMLIKSMRDAIGRDPIFGSDQEEAYQGMYDDQLSLELTRGHGLGLADMLVRQLQRHAGSAAGTPTSTSPGSSATSGVGGAAISGTGRTGASGAAVSTQGAAASGAARTSSGRHSSALPPASKAEQTSFIREVWPQAQQAGAELGVAPTSLVAQAALETDWGRSVPRDASGRSSHNLFGIKAGAAWKGQSVSTVTQEFAGAPQTAGPSSDPQAARPTVASFRAYSGRGESFRDYVALIGSDPRYAHALNTGDDVHAFASALQRGGYATDPDYARKLSAVAGSVASALADAPPQQLLADAAGPQPAATAMAALDQAGGSARVVPEPLKFTSSAPINVETDRL